MSPPRFCTVLLLLLSLSSIGRSQPDSLRRPVAPGYQRETFRLLPSDSVIRLSSGFVIEGTESVLLDSSRLEKDVQFSVDAVTGILRLLPAARAGIGDTTIRLLVVEYRRLPPGIKREYSLYRLEGTADSAGRVRQTLRPSAPPFSLGSVFGPGLTKSGSILRGVTVGSNRDLSLNSGFRLQLSGPIAENVEVVAALSDESSPIQPEGTTQTLQELDKVFVQIQSPQYGATLGDFNLEIDQKVGGEFGRIFRKLQGAQGRARWGDPGSAPHRAGIELTAGSPRGKFASNIFQGREGSQGPYQLTGERGERRILVIAGTERVFLNGESMTRGETNDYVIDYASAEITFSSRRLITSASRITVDFEYTDRNYERSILAASSSASLFRSRLQVNTVLFQEGDDPGAAIDAEMNDTTRAILQRAGGDPFAAVVPGARFVGRDAETGVGLGQYAVTDTSVNGRIYPVYRYAPGSADAVYSISFSIVDRMPPDSMGYRRVRLGHFEAVGVGQGNYLPVRFLPLPQLRRLAAVNAQADVTEELQVAGELAVSDLDANRVSAQDDEGSAGSAFRLAARYRPRRLSLAGLDLGSLELAVSERRIDRRFNGMDRVNEVEFDRKWNELPVSGRQDEEIREGSIRYAPLQSLTVGGSYGLRSLEGAQRSERIEGNLTLQDSTLAQVSYRVEHIASRSQSDQLASDWTRQFGTAHMSIGVLTPTARLEAEDRSSWRAPDSLLDRGVRFVEIEPGLKISGVGPWEATAGYALRAEDSTVAGRFAQASRAGTQRYALGLRDWNDLSWSLAVQIRDLDYTAAFEERGNADAQTVLARSETRFTPLRRGVQTDLFYELASERSARLERVFVRVPAGTGSYRYRGDLNGNGMADEEEFELTRFDGDFSVVQIAGEELVPVVQVKASLRLRLQPSRFLPAEESFAASILRRLTTETFARVDERSTDTDVKNVSMLRLGTFQNPATTISGATWFRQDMSVDEQSPTFSLRLRHEQRRGLVQTVTTVERSLLSEQSVRVRFQPVRDIGGVADYVQRRDRMTPASPTPRQRDLSVKTLSGDLFYRPQDQVEVGLRLGTTAGTDRFGGEDAAADVNDQTLRLVYALPARGQVRLELTREEVVLTRPYRDPERLVPFELTGGRIVGQTFLWSVASEYRIDQHVQLSVRYDGRREGRRSAVHTARAEVRAAF